MSEMRAASGRSCGSSRVNQSVAAGWGPSPAARRGRPARGSGLGGGFRVRHAAVDAAVELAEPPTAATPAQRDDLGGDRHGRLLGGAGAEVEADRARHPLQLRVGQPRLAQPGEPVVVGGATPWRRYRRPPGAAAPPRAAVRRTSVVGQHGDHRAGVERARRGLPAQVAVRPLDDHLVGVGETSRGREPAGYRGPSPGNRRTTPPGQRPPRSRSPRDQHARPRRVRRAEPRMPSPPRWPSARTSAGCCGPGPAARGRHRSPRRRPGASRSHPARGRRRPRVVQPPRPGRPRAGSGCSTTVTTATG